MAYIIDSNHFSIDSYSLRGLRFDFLSKSINNYAAELTLEAAMLDWALNADANWRQLNTNHSTTLGEKFTAYQTSQEADAALFAKYADLKALLISRYSDDTEQLRIFGVEGNMPYKRDQRVGKAFDLIRGNELRDAEGDPRVLPPNMIDALQTLADAAVNNYYTARQKLDESCGLTKATRELFVRDSYKLSALFNWVIAIWGGRDLRLIDLGFMPKKPRGGRKIAAPENLSYDAAKSLFSWDKMDNASSYQLSYSKLNGRQLTEIYAGKEAEFEYIVGAGEWSFVVRARNKHGYGKWGEAIVVVG